MLDTLSHPITTEKAVRLMESQNKLSFMVAKDASKSDVKKAVEEQFKVKVVKVTTLITPLGKKKAFIKLAPENPAIDVATKLGLL